MVMSFVLLLKNGKRVISERRFDVRSFQKLLAIGLIGAWLCSPTLADGPKKGSPGTQPATCGDHGTSVHFEKNVKDAAKKALKQEKLVLAIHISGYFEEPDYT
jgi:hypothetical protein